MIWHQCSSRVQCVSASYFCSKATFTVYFLWQYLNFHTFSPLVFRRRPLGIRQPSHKLFNLYNRRIFSWEIKVQCCNTYFLLQDLICHWCFLLLYIITYLVNSFSLMIYMYSIYKYRIRKYYDEMLT